jgi:hypothetical protein
VEEATGQKLTSVTDCRLVSFGLFQTTPNLPVRLVIYLYSLFIIPAFALDFSIPWKDAGTPPKRMRLCGQIACEKNRVKVARAWSGITQISKGIADAQWGERLAKCPQGFHFIST